MATQTWKLKNGLTLTPVDPSTLTNPQAGDIVCDSTDSNQIKRYNAVSASWVVLGSGGSGTGDLGVAAADLADSNVLADYTQTGLEILISPAASAVQLIHGTASYRLIHQAASTRSFKKTIALDSKFRGKNLTLKLWNRSTALSADCTILVRNETAATDLLASTQIQTDSAAYTVGITSGLATVSMASNADYNAVKEGMSITGTGIQTGSVIISKGANNVVTMNQNATATNASASVRVSGVATLRQFSFDVPDTCASLSWTISALQEANLPESYFDDITIELSAQAKNSTLITVNQFNTTEPAVYALTPTSVGGTAPTKGTIVRDRAYWWRQGKFLKIHWDFEQSSAGTAGTGTFYQFPLPSGIPQADLALAFASTTGQAENSIGSGFLNTTGDGFTQQTNYLRAFLIDPNNFGIFVNTSSAGTVQNSGYMAGASSVPIFNSYANLTMSLDIEIPIQSWTESSPVQLPIELSSSVTVTEPDSDFRVTGFVPVLASTATRIYRTLNAATPGTIQSLKGTGIRVEDDAANGTRITALRDGIYTICLSGDLGTAGGIGFSLNSSNLTTDFGSIPASEKLLGTFESGGNSVPTLTWTGFLAANSVVRPHGHGTTTGADALFASLQVSCQGRLKILNASSDQKIEIPTHEVRFEDALGRGATDTNIVRFNVLAGIRGDGLSVSNTAANGTVITVQKDGVLTLTSSLVTSSQATIFVTRNMTTGLSSGTPQQSERLDCGTVIANNYGNVSWSGSVKKNDVIRIWSNVTPPSDAGQNLNIILQEQKVSVALSNVSPVFIDSDASLELNGWAGNGSTYTRVLRWSNVAQPDTTGKFTYTDSATDGGLIRVNEDGMYFITATFAGPNTNYGVVGLTKNEVLASTGSTPISSLTVAQGRIAQSYTPSVPSGGGGNPQCVFYGKLLKGDLIRGRTDGTTTGDATACYFSIVKIGKPSVTGVDVTPFLNIKYSEGDIGEIKAFATSGVPNDFLVCDGSAVLRASYPDLFTAIGIAHGQGDGSTTFHLPDYRGRFLRGTDGAANRDPDKASRTASNTGGNTGNNVGSVQADAFASHSHTITGYGSTVDGGNPFILAGFNGVSPRNTAQPNIATGGNETRPVNAYVTYGIRWRAAAQAVISQAKSYRLSDYLSTGTKVSGVDPANLGEYRPMYRSANSNTLNDCSTLATPPSVANGMFIDGSKPWATVGSATIAQYYRIFIGKNKSWKMDWFSTNGRTGGMSPDYFVYASPASNECGAITRYDPTTGVLEVDAAFLFSAGNTARYLGTTASGGVTNTGYFDVTVFDSPFVAFPRIMPTTTDITASTSYNVPSGCLYIEVEVVGGGGAGANTTGTGGTGGTTSFGSFVSCPGGGGGSGAQGGQPGALPTISGAAQRVIAMIGNGGNSGQQTGPTQSGYPGSGMGGPGPWGGGAPGTSISAGGVNGAANSGAGGSGSNPGLSNNSTSGGGGASGSYARVRIPASAITGSIAVTIGAGGVAGGSNGGSGRVLVHEHYR